MKKNNNSNELSEEIVFLVKRGWSMGQIAFANKVSDLIELLISQEGLTRDEATNEVGKIISENENQEHPEQ